MKRGTFPNNNWAVLGLGSKTSKGNWGEGAEVPQRDPGAEPLVEIKDRTVSPFYLTTNLARYSILKKYLFRSSIILYN